MYLNPKIGERIICNKNFIFEILKKTGGSLFDCEVLRSNVSYYHNGDKRNWCMNDDNCQILRGQEVE